MCVILETNTHLRISLLCLLLAALSTTAQMNTQTSGLRSGLWKETYTTDLQKEVAIGHYVIIPKDTFAFIRNLGETTLEVRYKGTTSLQFYHSKRLGQLSVKNGLWKHYDGEGNLVQEVNWIAGIYDWWKDYDRKGNLLEYRYTDFEGDTTFHLYYQEGRVFKKTFYPPGDKNHRRELYYPESPLSVSDGELLFSGNFINNTFAPKEVALTVTKPLTIAGISSHHQSIQAKSIDGRPLSFPLYLSPSSPLRILCTTRPQPSSYIQDDTIRIYTSDGALPYKIYAHTIASHVSYGNVRKIKSLYLSKSCDAYLVVAPMGTVTDATIFKNGQGIKYYEIEGITRIDLSTYPPGEYEVRFTSCHTGGKVKLILSE